MHFANFRLFIGHAISMRSQRRRRWQAAVLRSIRSISTVLYLLLHNFKHSANGLLFGSSVLSSSPIWIVSDSLLRDAIANALAKRSHWVTLPTFVSKTAKPIVNLFFYVILSNLFPRTRTEAYCHLSLPSVSHNLRNCFSVECRFTRREKLRHSYFFGAAFQVHLSFLWYSCCVCVPHTRILGLPSITILAYQSCLCVSTRVWPFVTRLVS